jgi:hypothetical protein
MRNLHIAAAVVAVLGAASAQAALPSLGQCAGGTQIYIAGSSAAQNSFSNALQTDLFGGAGNMLTVSATNGNFEAFCGTITNTAHPSGLSGIVAIHYRGEGGSVVGALPIVSGKTIKFLNLSTASCAATGTLCTVTTTGTTASNGPTDTWGGPLTSHIVEIGVSDVEPGILTGNNYPASYSTGVFGSASAAQLGALGFTATFGQVFGLFVNTSGFSTTSINLSRESAQNLLNGTYTDWSKVPDAATGNPTTNSSIAVALKNREAGSGSRTATSNYFFSYPCNTLAPQGDLTDAGATADFYATGDVLKNANLTGGAITYASIENSTSTKYPNMHLAQINGVQPSSLAAATGEYDFWVESGLISNSAASGAASTLQTWLQSELADVTTAAHTANIVTIPGAGWGSGNAATTPPTSNTNGTGTIYSNIFTRVGNTCAAVVPAN